jgi:hypothetical protein
MLPRSVPIAEVPDACQRVEFPATPAMVKPRFRSFNRRLGAGIARAPVDPMIQVATSVVASFVGELAGCVPKSMSNSKSLEKTRLYPLSSLKIGAGTTGYLPISMANVFHIGLIA